MHRSIKFEFIKANQIKSILIFLQIKTLNNISRQNDQSHNRSAS
jgi:hypothetical protein